MYKVLLLAFCLGLVFVGTLAEKRGRNVIGWICLSFLITPYLSLVILLLTDKLDSKKKDLTVNQEGRYWFAAILGCALFLTPLFLPSIYKWHNDSYRADYVMIEGSSYNDVTIHSFTYRFGKFEARVHNDTEYNVEDLVFRVTYYNSRGEQIDYCDYPYHFVIEKDMSKTCQFERGDEYPRAYDKAEIKVLQYTKIGEEKDEEAEIEGNSFSI